MLSNPCSLSATNCKKAPPPSSKGNAACRLRVLFLRVSPYAAAAREREAAAKLKEMEEYLDLRALQARQVPPPNPPRMLLTRRCMCAGPPSFPPKQACSTATEALCSAAAHRGSCRGRRFWRESAGCELGSRGGQRVQECRRYPKA
jgi:hypothetical protein